MNAAAHYRIDAGPVRGNGRFLLGVGISIVLHVLLLLAYRNTAPPAPAFEAEEPVSIAVRILPPEPLRIEPAPPAPPREAAPRLARRSAPKRIIAVPASPGPDAAPDSATVQQPDQAVAPADNAPQFDMNAARQTARQLAGQTKLGREGTALAQFPDPPLQTESKEARAISQAKRRLCKDGLPGGLLAPLFLLMDKKDSGCKW
ncbi:hypothetical protein [Massilia yuzhufengensis]|uniref:Uncharacterized protein n=1 Tax=Massilia yuzhufengensis TaxID=1164594 RepID=A0A1I1D8M9_9BURK|nr:hypothetical protein [Massilia yuzhufengensis]SFB70742.1 hypothetical protein SAMN05216204_10157 [Massilia yuzhufengensis]